VRRYEGLALRSNPNRAGRHQYPFRIELVAGGTSDQLVCAKFSYICVTARGTSVTTSQQGTAATPGNSLSTLEIAIVVLIGITAVIHLYAGFMEGEPPLLLAGLGYGGGGALYLWGMRRRVFAVAATPYTTVQIPLWVVAKAGDYTLVGYVDKAVQVVLIVALLALIVGWRRD
jgi:hypothetical protein